MNNSRTPQHYWTAKLPRAARASDLAEIIQILDRHKLDPIIHISEEEVYLFFSDSDDKNALEDFGVAMEMAIKGMETQET